MHDPAKKIVEHQKGYFERELGSTYDYVFQEIAEIVTNCTLLSFRGQTLRNDAVSSAITDPKRLVFGHKMAFVFLAGDALKLIFKVHYMTQVVKELVTIRFQKAPKSVTDRYADDYMKEFCNVAMGKSRGILESRGIGTGMSLPAVARGIDEMRYRIFRKPGQFFHYWDLGDDQLRVTCSIVAELIRPDRFRNFNTENKTETDAFEWNEIELF